MFIERENGRIVSSYASQQDWEMEEVADTDPELIAFLDPPPRSDYTLSKLTIWTRLTDPEAEAVDDAMAAQSAKLRGVWNTAQSVQSDSEFFGTLKAFLTVTLSEKRAGELLKAEG